MGGVEWASDIALGGYEAKRAQQFSQQDAGLIGGSLEDFLESGHSLDDPLNRRGLKDLRPATL
jgi:hypothetical protein